MAMFVPGHRGPLTEDTLYRVSAAGAESNVARYLARLGVASAWISRIGADAFGDLLVAELERDGVDVSRVERDIQRPTGVAFKERGATHTQVHYYRKHSAATAMGPAFAEESWALSPQILHLSGITPALSAECRDFMLAAVDARPPAATVSFDVNWRPALWDSADPSILHRIAQTSNIVFVGLDEAQAAWNIDDVDEVRAFLDRPDIVVVKRGAAGCSVFDGADRIDVPALEVDVVEPVGAGDAFAAGFLRGRLRGADVKRSAKIGTIVASSALSVATDVGALPEKTYFQRLLELRDDEWLATRYAPRDESRSSAHVANR